MHVMRRLVYWGIRQAVLYHKTPIDVLPNYDASVCGLSRGIHNFKK